MYYLQLPLYDEQPPPTRQAYFVEPSPPPVLEEKVGDARRLVSNWWRESEVGKLMGLPYGYQNHINILSAC